MIFDIRLLAAQKHKETQHAEVEWIRALENARQSLKFIEIDYQSLAYIAVASKSPKQFIAMTRLIYQYGKLHPNGEPIAELILRSVNDSPFSLPDWIEAIEYFYLWLEQEERKIDFLAMLKYLDCCSASQDAKGGGQTLAALIEDMLRVIGYEG